MKQVIVIRKDLNMTKEKLAVQCAHASHQAIINRSELIDDYRVLAWLDNNYTKIVVGVDSEKELLEIYNKSKGYVFSSLIKDIGKTEFKKPTYTTVAVGPDFDSVIDNITGHLKLL